MSGTAIISADATWTVGTHGFYPIVERIRADFPVDSESVTESIFSTLDQGLDIISLEEIDRENYMKFHHTARLQLQKFLNEDGDGVAQEYYDGIVECWEGLIQMLEHDPRFTPGTDKGPGKTLQL